MANLKFPLDIDSSTEYPSKIRFRLYESDQNNPTDEIILPVPVALTNNYSVNYDDIDANIISRITGEVLADAASNPARTLTSQTEAGLSALWKTGKTALEAGAATLLDQEPFQFLRRDFGFSINKASQLTINKPQNRNFSFRFEFAPKNEKESKAVENIIQTFKVAMHPSTSRNGGGAGAGYFYFNPATMRVDFLTGNQKNDYTFTTWYCFLSGMEVNYHNAGAPSYFADGQQTNKSLNLNLTEITPLSRAKIKELETSSNLPFDNISGYESTIDASKLERITSTKIQEYTESTDPTNNVPPTENE